MNIAFLLTPKSDLTYLYDDQTLRQVVEKLRKGSYSAVPVISKDGSYISTLSEGDVLRFLLDESEKTGRGIDLRDMEDYSVKSALSEDKNPPCLITAEPEDLVFRAMEQNFIPVVDDGGSFIGIVTRRDILRYLATYNGGKIKL